jgi:hypothetical protein
MSTMSSMERPNDSQPPSIATRLIRIDPDTGKEETLHIEPLTLPELFSVPSFISWLRKPFQRGAKT